jgi:hypothetical protein
MTKKTTINQKVNQVDGDHYEHLGIDPFEYCHRNGIGFIAGTAIKHITRYKQKAGKTDLLKAISEIERLIQVEYGEDVQSKPVGKQPVPRVSKRKARTQA